MSRPEDILGFWFDGLSEGVPIDPSHPCYKRWFGGKPEVDTQVTQNFRSDVEAARSNEYDSWTASPHATVALVLLLDQFPRHIYRGDRRAFDSDRKALAISKDCVGSRVDETLSLFERLFLYLPLQHSEHMPDHDIAYERFSALKDAAKGHPTLSKFFEQGLKNEIEHMEAIQRFGRYPYRNEALGRKSTPEELDFLSALKRNA